VRPVHTTTKDGRAYEDVDYWTEDGRWSSQRSDALDFARGDRDKATALTVRLRKAAKTSEVYGEPTGVLLGPGEDPWPQPPASLERARQDSNLRPGD
jgi:hypothetical protein